MSRKLDDDFSWIPEEWEKEKVTDIQKTHRIVKTTTRIPPKPPKARTTRIGLSEREIRKIDLQMFFILVLIFGCVIIMHISLNI